MDPIKDFPTGPNVPEKVFVFVEVPKGSLIKYEYDKRLGVLTVDRYLHSAVFFPGDYGLVPKTYCDDGDPLDAIVLVTSPGYPGTLVAARPIGMLKMDDEKGGDDKLICVPADDPRFEDIKDIKDLPQHQVKEIVHFFEVYKALEPGKFVKVRGYEGLERAVQLIKHSIDLYKRKFG